MRKQTRLIAAVLLIATVVSVFAVLPAFAANDAGSKINSSAKPKNGITVLSDFGSKTEITQNNQGQNAAGTKVPTMTKTEEGGVPVWIHDWKDTMANESVTGGNWLNVGGLGFGTRVRDDKGAIDANYGRLGGAKNTDYLVLDFDIASDTAIPYQTYLNTRCYQSGTVTSTNSSTGSNYPAWGMEADGRIYISNANDTNKHYATVESGGKYTHITFVWDFHTKDDGSIENKCYTYINGAYVGNIASFGTSTAAVYFMRMQVENKHNNDYEQAKYANFTLKQFGAGFEGVMAEDGKLANAEVTLADIPELAYCMENAPGTIADIKRVVDDKPVTINVTNPDDLSGDLLDGDKVIVYKEIADLKAAYLVKMVAGADGDVSANITWVDKNGVAIGEEGSLIANKPVILEVASAAKWVALNLAGTGIKTWGSAQSFADKDASNKWVCSDPVYVTRYSQRSGGVQFVFFDDYTMYGRSASTTLPQSFVDQGIGTTYVTTSGSRGQFTTDTIFDMNGHTLTVSPNQHLVTVYDKNVDITFKNGNLVESIVGNNFIAATTTTYTNSTVTFDNVNFTSTNKSSTIFDFRVGTVIFNNSTITMAKQFLNMKAVDDGHTYCEITNTTVNYSGSKPFIDFTQTNAAGSSTTKTRQGGGNLHLTITGSTMNMMAQPIVGATAYPNGTSHSGNATACKNMINYFVDIIDSKITHNGKLVTITGDDTNFPKYGTAGDVSTITANPIRVTLAMNVTNSDIRADALVGANPYSADYNLNSVTTTINVEGSALKLMDKNGVAGGFTCDDVADDATAITIVNLGEGNVLSCTNESYRNSESYVSCTVNHPVGTVLANTANYSGYNYIVTKDYTHYTYKAGDQEGAFDWNAPANGVADAVDMSRFATLLDGEAGLYEYTWTVDESNHYTPKAAITFAAKANLTLFDNLYYNLFINKASYDSFAEYISFNGGDYTLNTDEVIVIDEVEYYQIQVKDILPQNAGKTAVSVSFNIPEGKYGEAISHTTELSVLSYVKSTYSGTKNLHSKNLMAAILNYIAAAMDYNSNPDGAAEVRALFDDVRIDKPGSDSISGTASDVEVSVEFKSELAYIVRALSDTTLSVKYTTTSGTEGAYSVALKEGETFTIKVKAYDFYNGITFTTAAGSTTVSPEGYYNALTDEADKAMMSAIYSYGYAANAYYKAQNPAA